VLSAPMLSGPLSRGKRAQQQYRTCRRQKHPCRSHSGFSLVSLVDDCWLVPYSTL
jgi:hypothetical protein